MKFQNLVTRSLSGLVYIAIIIGAILCGLDTVIILGALFSTLACIEFAKMTNRLNVANLPAVLLDIAGCISLCCIPVNSSFIFIWIFIMILRMVAELYLKAPNPLKNLALSLMSQAYFGIAMAMMTGIASLSTKMLLVVFIFIWLNDTGAFIVGSAIGRHRLFERISPKKSWEGFFGGLIFNLAASAGIYYGFNHSFMMDLTLPSWLGLGTIVTIFATWGDLIESLIKRHLNLKDSGNLIPGHGGILDRIDSLLLVAPTVMCYLFILLTI